MQIPFTKMNSQGNDFVVIDNTNLLYNFTHDQITSICSRSIIGCDQLLLLNVKNSSHVACQIFNQDGSSAKQCGNGMRAIMLFLNKEYSYTSCKIYVNLVPYSVDFIDNENIRVDMGTADYAKETPSSLPEGVSANMENDYFKIISNNKSTPVSFSYCFLSIGNPHCIVFSSDCYAHREEISNIINSIYDTGVNISFVLNLDNYINGADKTLMMRVNERGSGWTKSCGSGATATGAFLLKLISLPEYGSRHINEIYLEQEGGTLKVEKTRQKKPSPGDEQHFYLIGPSTFEYNGIWND